ncbi:hypothetical protein [Tenacibaculum xiamenense]|uniref:hypothetical protein n=1 Tax=Tenacibaculum xiamenense TaxID=1261553 RepID=UPI003893155B
MNKLNMIKTSIDNKFPCKNIDIHEFVKLERIPEKTYERILNYFESKYHFKNGEKMQLGNYYVKLDKRFSDSFVAFIKEVLKGKYENISSIEGFKPSIETLIDIEAKGDFTFGSFDMAVTEKGLQNIEFQAVATYPISAAKMNTMVLNSISDSNAFVFAENMNTNWDDFIKFYNKIFQVEGSQEVVLVDREIDKQKTKFEFFATQKELNVPVKIVDIKEILENNDSLYYKNRNDFVKIKALYNRVLITEALYKDNYPEDSDSWKFRFDKKYNDLKYLNHPIKQFEISKRLCPYIEHEYNPNCYELSNTKHLFKQNDLHYKDFVWKHKWGAAGNDLILEPNEEILESLEEKISNYIAQEKIKYKVFTTDDQLDKIVELRFMTAAYGEELIIVPMARIGYVEKTDEGTLNYRIHFSDNNKKGYGFSPVVLYDNIN